MKTHNVLPLQQDPGSSLFPWIIAVMTFLLLLVGLCVKLHYLFVEKTLQEHAPSLTIEVPFTVAQKTGIETVTLRALQKVPSVTKAEVVPMSHLKKTLERFLGETKVYAPYPILFHVWSNTPSHRLVPQLKSALGPLNLAPHFLVHEALPRGVRLWNNMLNHIFTAGFAVLGLCLLLFLSFSLATHLKIHAPILKLFVLIGAPKKYIQRQFQAQIRRSLYKGFSYALPACTIGVALAFFLLDCWGVSSLMLSPEFFVFFVCFVLATLGGILVLAAFITNTRISHLFGVLNTKGA